MVIDGKTLRVPPLGVPAGPTFADCAGLTSDLVDLDDDGVADSAAGKLRMTGPGIDLPDVAWELVRAVDPSACNEGTTGTVMLGVTKDACDRLDQCGIERAHPDTVRRPRTARRSTEQERHSAQQQKMWRHD